MRSKDCNADLGFALNDCGGGAVLLREVLLVHTLDPGYHVAVFFEK